jgi:hypothetical protein
MSEPRDTDASTAGSRRQGHSLFQDTQLGEEFGDSRSVVAKRLGDVRRTCGYRFRPFSHGTEWHSVVLNSKTPQRSHLPIPLLSRGVLRFDTTSRSGSRPDVPGQLEIGDVLTFGLEVRDPRFLVRASALTPSTLNDLHNRRKSCINSG